MIGHDGPMEPILIVLGIILVIVIGGGQWLYAGRRRGQVPDEISAHEPMSVEDLLPSEDEDAEEETTGEGAAEPAATLESPESIPGRMQRLRARLAGAGGFGKAVLSVLSRGDLTEEDWEEIEDTLLTSDLGIEVTTSLMEELRTQAKVLGTSDPEAVRTVLRAELLKLVDPSLDRSLNLERPIPAEGAQGTPAAAILMVGVNGTGKTTTCGKLARVLVSMGHKVLLGAADTFRAAAADQLEAWGRRVGATTVRGAEAADPASVAFDAVSKGVETHADVVLIDTAGRLHNSTNLMDQLRKVKRVVEKKAVVDEVLLVLDATTGQNGLVQAKTFGDVVNITGVVLTKLDGTAKGGIVFQVQEDLGVPVKLVGLGEGADDLAPFEVEGFVDALLG